MNDLTVFCVYWGTKYDKRYVYALRDMVAKHLTLPHEFKVITTDSFQGLLTVKPFVPYSAWWQKLGLFAPRIATGPSLYFDLDVVITGNIDYLAGYTNTFSAPANWARSGHGGIQSSVMAWPGNWSYPLDKIREEWPGESTPDGYTILGGKKVWGDQEYLTLILNDWQRIPGIGSYKYHIQMEGRSEPPDWMRVCCFHGKPDYHEVGSDWIVNETGGWWLESSIPRKP